MTVAWLGTGLLGANFVRAMRKRGETVRVWNRTSSKAQALAAETGAVACADPAEAVRGAARVHLCLSDDASVNDTLAKAAPGFERGVDIIDHTTTSPEGATERTRAWSADASFTHAPLFMGPPNALAGTGTILVSGDQARFARLEPALKPMTGQVVYLGADPARAALFKLMGNLFILAMGASLVDMRRMAHAHGVADADMGAMFDWFVAPRDPVPRFQRLTTADLAQPYWELDMARKDARLMLEAAGGAERLITIPAIAAAMDKAIAQGFGRHDWLVIGQDA